MENRENVVLVTSILTMLRDLMVMGWLWEVTGRGINGAPTTPSKSWISVFWSPKSDDDAEDSTFGFIHDFMLCQALLVPLLMVKISSGMGTSSTVWSPSWRARLGQSFFIEEREMSEENVVWFWWAWNEENVYGLR